MDKAIQLGHPSYVWRFGQDRRLNMIRADLPMDNAQRAGHWLRDWDVRRKISRAGCARVRCGCGRRARHAGRHEKGLETLAIECVRSAAVCDEVYEGCLLHEVIEHVTNDRDTIAEAHRVAKHGGVVIVFAPNRLYPFETHGAYFGKR